MTTTTFFKHFFVQVASLMPTAIILNTLIFAAHAHAGRFTAQMIDQNGNPLGDAVIELISETAQPHSTKNAVITQQDLMFVPWVSAIQKNTLVEFPNHDKTRHHVYSFSDAKTFELKLYANTPETPVLFDQAGIVVLGCNIHDHMQAYIFVGESPYLAISDQSGTAVLDNLPAGNYTVQLWHPWQNIATATQTITINEPQQFSTFRLDITPQRKPKPPKRGFGKNYR